MRIVVLYCSFFFPFSYVIAKNGYVEQNSAKYYSLTEQDTLYIGVLLLIMTFFDIPKNFDLYSAN